MVGACPGGTEFEFLIVGGGSAGCVLAARLSEGGRDVCLVEAGPDYGPYDGGRWPRDILDARRLAFSHAWETEREDRSQLRARIMGGCSAHNACVVLAGAPADYDEWGEGWSHATIAPYLERAERELRVRRFADEELSPWHRAFAQAAGADAIVHPVNDVGAVRWNTAFAYLDPARGRENLTIRADTLVDRVLLDGDRAVGRRHDGGRAARRPRRARRRRLRLAGDPAAQRHRPRARAAGRRGADRPRRRRLRLRGDRPPAARGGGVRARAAALHGAGDDRRRAAAPAPRACATSSSSRRSIRRARRATRCSAAVFAMKPALARHGPPDLARPARAAGHRPRLPHRRARRRGARRGRGGAAAAGGRPRRSALRGARGAPGPRGRRRAPRARGRARLLPSRRHVRDRRGGRRRRPRPRHRRAVGRRRLDHADDPARQHEPEHDRAGRARWRSGCSAASSGLRRCRRLRAAAATRRAARGRRRRAGGGPACRTRCGGTGSSGTPSFAAGAPAEREFTVVGVARRAVPQPGDVDVAPRAARGSGARRRRAPWRPASAGRSAVPRPTSSRARARRTSAGGSSAPAGATSAAAPRWSGCRCRGAPRRPWRRATVARGRRAERRGRGQGDQRADARGVVVGARVPAGRCRRAPSR